MEEARLKVQNLSDDLQKIQEDARSNIEALQKLDSQLHENKNVHKEELSQPKQSAEVYKLVGPVLLRQDWQEAVMAVESRLNFIEKEKVRIEGRIKELQGHAEQTRTEILGVQSTLRSGE